jgi:hypothetical protein
MKTPTPLRGTSPFRGRIENVPTAGNSYLQIPKAISRLKGGVRVAGGGLKAVRPIFKFSTILTFFRDFELSSLSLTTVIFIDS